MRPRAIWLSVTLALLACSSEVIVVSPGGGGGGSGGPGDPAGPGGSNARCDTSKPFGEPEALTALNTSASELSPRLSKDGLALYYSVVVPTGSQAATYMAKRASLDAPFGSPELVGTTGLPARPTNAALSDDELTIVQELYEGKDEGSHLYMASRPDKNGTFGPFKRLTTLNAGKNDLSPYLVGDGTVLYFASERAGSESLDLYRATRASPTGAFGAPAKVEGLGGGAELYPAPSADELTMYFASKRGGSAGLDIYVATRASADVPFDAPAPVAEVNSPGDDHPGSISADGCELYLSSNRTGGAGEHDLYVARRGK
jgi:Tol biopolymer transport system component